MLRRALLLSLGLAVISSAGCWGPAPPPAPRISVTGTVKLDGTPIANGEIVFSVPTEPKKAPTVFSISNGAYSGIAHEGKSRVEVYVLKEGPPPSTEPDGPPTKVNIIPAKYHGPGSVLSAEVKAGDANTFPFNITSN